eukprot:1591662-Rhodomonas_salina.1
MRTPTHLNLGADLEDASNRSRGCTELGLGFDFANLVRDGPLAPGHVSAHRCTRSRTHVLITCEPPPSCSATLLHTCVHHSSARRVRKATLCENSALACARGCEKVAVHTQVHFFCTVWHCGAAAQRLSRGCEKSNAPPEKGKGEISAKRKRRKKPGQTLRRIFAFSRRKKSSAQHIPRSLIFSAPLVHQSPTSLVPLRYPGFSFDTRGGTSSSTFARYPENQLKYLVENADTSE